LKNYCFYLFFNVDVVFANLFECLFDCKKKLAYCNYYIIIIFKKYIIYIKAF